MMYDEFIELTGSDITFETYNEKIEPAYMLCDIFRDKHSFIAFFKEAGLSGCMATYKLSEDKKRIEEENRMLISEKVVYEEMVRASNKRADILEQRNAEYRSELQHVKRKMQYPGVRY